jgi:glycosyltransferase involved in cell wall biosynthesis
MTKENSNSVAVSVILAVYNTDSYLRSAIKSILSQTLIDFELVIIDDGSTDDSPKILNELKEKDLRIRIIRQTNGGIGAATQTGIENSHGEYIAIMDSDDISLPNRLALQKQFLDMHPDIDAVGSQWRMLNAEGKDIGIDTHSTNPELISALMYAYFPLHHPTTMIRRRALDKVGGYSLDRSCVVPDYDVFMRMQLAGCKFANLPEILFLWRLNPASTTHSKARIQASSVADVRDNGFKELVANNPQKAADIAKSIVYSFPTGTWQDDRIEQLLPDKEQSSLYCVWLGLTEDTPEDCFNKALVLWLKTPGQHCEILREKLIANNKPWLAALVDAYRGIDNVDPAVRCDKLNLDTVNRVTVSLFVTYNGANEDFNLRLQQAFALKALATFSMEIIVVSVRPELSLQPFVQLLSTHDCIFDEEGIAWNTAFHKASGAYFVYSEDNFRFNTGAILEALESQFQHETPITFMPDTRYFAEALDENGSPALDNQFHPIWTRSTLLQKDRVRLSNIIHHRSLLHGFQCNLSELGTAAGRHLGRYLAIKNEFNMIEGVVNYFIPEITLTKNPLPIFQQTIGDWHLDYGMTNFPAPIFHENLPKSQIAYYAQSLSKAWLANNLFIYPGNITVLENFYLNRVDYAIKTPLFRHLLICNKKNYLLLFWQNKAYLNTVIALFYCIYHIMAVRLFAPLKK